MRLKLYRAASVAEAMAQVRSELGPEALILSTRRLAQGVELTAALEQEDLAADLPPQVAIRPPPQAAIRPPPQAAIRPPPHAAIDAPQQAATDLSPRAAIDLSHHGLPAPLLAKLSVHGSPEGIARALRGMLRFSPLPLAGPHGTEAPPLLLAGMPGAGKTLAVARLATRLVLSGIRPTVITADGKRAGAAEELAAFTRLLGVKLMVAGTPATLSRAVAAAADQAGVPGPVLIDSAGVNPFMHGDVTAVAELAAAVQATPVLVMQAGLHPDDAADQAHAFAPIGCRHLLPTRLDLTRRLGSIVAAAVAEDLALTEGSAGPGATDPLLPMTPESLAARLLGIEHAPAPPLTLRRPVFPTARAHAAHAWSNEAYG